MLLSEKVMLLTETFSSLPTVTTDDGTTSVFAETIKQQQPTTSENQRTVQLWWTMNIPETSTVSQSIWWRTYINERYFLYIRNLYRIAWRWSSTTSTWTQLRSTIFHDPLLLVHNSAWRRKPTTVISSKACWSYMNCDHRRCTRSVNTILSFYRASEVHGMYIHLYRAFISRYARHILLFRWLPCTRRQHARHLLSCYRLPTCTALILRFVYRASADMHGSYC